VSLPEIAKGHPFWFKEDPHVTAYAAETLINPKVSLYPVFAKHPIVQPERRRLTLRSSQPNSADAMPCRDHGVVWSPSRNECDKV
jgi:hypothetical protein